MTPEERASQVWFELELFIPPITTDGILLRAACRSIIESAIRAAVEAEHTRITEMAEQIEQGTYTTSRSVAQVLRAERVARYTQEISPK